MPRGGFRPGAGRKPKAATADKQATPKAAPEKKRKPKAGAPYVDSDGVRTEHAPANWPFGRLPPQELPSEAPKADLSDLMPLDFLLQVMRDEEEEKGRRMQAATLAAQYCHAKPAPKTAKQEAEAERKKNAQTGRFGRRQPPMLKAVQGGKS